MVVDLYGVYPDSVRDDDLEYRFPHLISNTNRASVMSLVHSAPVPYIMDTLLIVYVWCGMHISLT